MAVSDSVDDDMSLVSKGKGKGKGKVRYKMDCGDGMPMRLLLDDSSPQA